MLSKIYQPMPSSAHSQVGIGPLLAPLQMLSPHALASRCLAVIMLAEQRHTSIRTSQVYHPTQISDSTSASILETPGMVSTSKSMLIMSWYTTTPVDSIVLIRIYAETLRTPINMPAHLSSILGTQTAIFCLT